LALALALGCTAAPPAAAPPALSATPFVNRSPGGQLAYLAERLPEACVAEAATVAALTPHEGKARIEVSGTFSVQAETLAAVANWVDRQTGRQGSAEVHRRFGADAGLLDLIQRELAQRLLLDVLPQDATLHLQLGETLRAQRLYGEARAAMRAAVARAPDAPGRARAQFYVGRVSEDLGDDAAARTAYEVALREDPSAHGARFNLAVLCFRTGDVAAARAHLVDARERRPDDPAVHVALAHLAEAQGDLEGALLEYRNAARLEPAAPLHRLAVGSALARLGRYREAMQEFARVRAEEPGNRLALLGLGMAAANLGDADTAREHLGDFIAAARRDPSLAQEMAQAQDALAALPR
jgi:tetratricopeptide (TPR) repeat protein